MCKQCSDPLPRGRAKFCSEPCRSRYWNGQRNMARTAERVAARVATRQPCHGCGGPIPPERKGGALYCSAACKKLAANERWAATSADYMRRYLYGITPQQWEAMWLWQGGRCAICRTDQWGGKTSRPHADHDHETGRFRGILCDACNNGLGRFRHTPELLLSASTYLTACI